MSEPAHFADTWHGDPGVCGRCGLGDQMTEPDLYMTGPAGQWWRRYCKRCCLGQFSFETKPQKKAPAKGKEP